MNKVAIHIGVFDDSHIWMQEAKKLGYRIVATHPMEISEKYYYNRVKGLIDEFHVVSYMDTQRLIQLAQQSGATLNIIHPCTNDASYAIGVVNSALGLKGITQTVAEKAASKEGWHDFLVENNLPGAKWCYRYNDIEDLESLEYPCIVKPNYGAGSQGIKKIYSAQELKQFMDTKEYDNGYYLTKKYDYYLVQEYTKAKYLVGCNSAVKDGKLIVFAHYAKNLNSLSEQMRQPYFYYEDGIFPTDDLDYMNDENLKLMQELVDKLGVDNSAIRFDVFMDENKKITSFVELNLRPGSSHSASCFHKIFGYNTTEELIKLNTDLAVNFSPVPTARWKYMYCKNFRFTPGKIRSIKWPELDEHVHHFSSQLKPGSVIPPVWNVATAGLCGELLLLGESKQQLLQKLDEFTRAIEIEYY